MRLSEITEFAAHAYNGQLDKDGVPTLKRRMDIASRVNTLEEKATALLAGVLRLREYDLEFLQLELSIPHDISNALLFLNRKQMLSVPALNDRETDIVANIAMAETQSRESLTLGN